MTDAPLTDTTVLKLGDVVQIAVQLTDRQTGQPYWWRRFAAVVELGPISRTRRGRYFCALTLKLHPDIDKDRRRIDLKEENQIVTLVPEERWPDGVVAIRMKLIAQRKIPLDGGLT